MSITSSLRQKVIGQIQVDPQNGFIAPLGIEFPDGTIMAGGISIGQIIYPAGATPAMVGGIGTYAPLAGTFANPISGPNVVVEYQIELGGTGTTITAGETPTLSCIGKASYSTGPDETLDQKLIPVNSITTPGTAAQISVSQPLYFGTSKQLTGFSIEFQLIGPATSSANVVAIGETTLDVYFGKGR